MRDPNLKFVDLTGDGHADILITEDDAFTWHPSLAEDGFGPAENVRQALDEERPAAGLRRRHTIHLPRRYVRRWPDRSGAHPQRRSLLLAEPGLRPLRRQGHHGPRALVRHPDQFDQKRIRLADIDGSGIIDIVYLHRDGVRIYFNQSGNAWSEPRTLRSFPPVDNWSRVTVVDLLGNGTACLVWSSPLPGDARGRCVTST